MLTGEWQQVKEQGKEKEKKSGLRKEVVTIMEESGWGNSSETKEAN